MALNWVLPVRVVQFIFSIIALGLSAHIVSVYKNFGYDGFEYDINLPQVNYNVFTSVFSILTLIYLIAASAVMKDTAFASPLVTVVIDFLNWVFWLAAFASIADRFNGFLSGEPAALLAFGVLNWVLFSVTLGFGIFAAIRARGGGSFKSGNTGGASTTTAPTTTTQTV